MVEEDVFKREYWDNESVNRYLEKLGVSPEQKALYFATTFFGVRDDGRYNPQEAIIKEANRIYEMFEGRRGRIDSRTFNKLWETGLLAPVDYFYVDPIILAEGRGSKKTWIGIHPWVLELLEEVDKRKQSLDSIFMNIPLKPRPYSPDYNYWFRAKGKYTFITKTFYRFMYGYMISNILCSINDDKVANIKIRTLTRTTRIEKDINKIIQYLESNLENINFDVRYYHEEKFEILTTLIQSLKDKIEEFITPDSKINRLLNLITSILIKQNNILNNISKIEKIWLVEIRRKGEPKEVTFGGNIASYTPGFLETKKYGSTIYVNREDFIKYVQELFNLLDMIDDEKDELQVLF
ncbi:hypothetical protein [Archaeoglobus profundus]|uniref:Uncharacterized protein n=1 Tax=Archaeoglobus profundus (strain DSM 5631 / JCM 9629 / NBRC 100127 / Av18) TaxID=572546 RepID=D2RHA9_ARCPA|nr:hypothetical protein [Archaeoglobus profundus]ADB57684.1 hypothetical protein Arcpr_0619 [Archaeoglobus profundus DSM 5631]